MRAVAHLRDRPGAPGTSGSWTAWIESIAKTSGRTASTWATTCGRSLGRRPERSARQHAETVGAASAPARRLLGADQQAACALAPCCPGPAGAGCSCPSRLAAEERDGTRHEPAAEHPVELGHPGRAGGCRMHAHLPDRRGVSPPRGPSAPGRGPHPRSACPSRRTGQRPSRHGDSQPQLGAAVNRSLTAARSSPRDGTGGGVTFTPPHAAGQRMVSRRGRATSKRPSAAHGVDDADERSRTIGKHDEHHREDEQPDAAGVDDRGRHVDRDALSGRRR